MGQRLSFSALFQFFYSYPLRPPGGEEKKTRRRGQPGGASSIFPLGLIPSVIICNYPLRPPGGASEGPVAGNLRVSPPRPLLATSPGIPLPFQSRTSPRPPDVLVFQQKLRFRNTRTCRHGIAWRGDQTKRFVFTLPAVPPGRGLGGSQVVPAPRQSLRRRDGVRTKGNTLVLTSCRPPCGDGCLRPPVPKAKLLLEQAGSEHRASARGTGGDSGGLERGLEGGQRPHNRPLSPARRAQGIESEQTEIKQKNNRGPLPRSYGPGNPTDGGPGYARRVTPLA